MPFLKNKAFNQLILKARFQKEEDLPFVLYQKPNDKAVKALFPSSPNLVYTTDFVESGFIFAPFDTNKNAILFSTSKKHKVSYEVEEKRPANRVELSENGKEVHLQLVNKAKDSINSGKLKKVVVSRRIRVETQKDGFELFELLLSTYPDTFKYLWYHPKVGMWLGATPETLLKVSNDILTTTSLAGTLPVIEKNAPNWGAKEIEEQGIVTDYILEKLSDKLGDLNTTKAMPVRAGKVWHLKSVIQGALREGIHLGEIIKALHPTPAVCGLPTDYAKEFLKANENYDREFYTGFLGELNVGSNRDSHLSVNLRCLKLKNNLASIFIGGGVTKESIAESEWIETQHKSKTMLGLL